MLAPTDRIDLWLADCRRPDDDLLGRYRSLLCEDERRRALRFRFGRDHRRYVVSRALLRTVLSRYAPTPPADWCFAANAYGRPEIANLGEVERSLSFNLSHSCDLIVLAVTHRRPLGVDIEAVEKARASIQIAERFFATEERAALKAETPEAQVERFFAYWTLKESYIKARGMGLRIPLDSFAFQLSAGSHLRFAASASTDGAGRWYFWQLRAMAGYLAAVCVAREPKPLPRLHLRQVVPLCLDEPIVCPVLRHSVD
jgi:4'-phosphopantetheinyl transferase